MAARSKAWVCGLSLVGIADSNPAGGMDTFIVSVLCCQVGLWVGLITRPGESYRVCVIECDHEWVDRG